MAGVVARVEDRWGIDLTRPFKPRGHWVTLVDLAIGPTPKPENATYLPQVQAPNGSPVRVTGLADRTDEGDLIIPAEARLTPIGFTRADPVRSEDLYLLDDRIVVVANVGEADLEAQLAGLFLVPTEDSLVNELSSWLRSSPRRPGRRAAVPRR